jgi:phage tail-like protein
MFNHDIFSVCRFYVMIDALAHAVFTEVSGIQVESEVMDYAEGGNNGFVHRLPGRTKFSNITLKRGMTSSNELFVWYMLIVQGKSFLRRNLTIIMYNPAGLLVTTWHYVNAYPVKWVGPQLTASGTQAAVETLELAHEGMLIDELGLGLASGTAVVGG